MNIQHRCQTYFTALKKNVMQPTPRRFFFPFFFLGTRTVRIHEDANLSTGACFECETHSQEGATVPTGKRFAFVGYAKRIRREAQLCTVGLRKCGSPHLLPCSCDNWNQYRGEESWLDQKKSSQPPSMFRGRLEEGTMNEMKGPTGNGQQCSTST